VTQRSDVRRKVVKAAHQLVEERGCQATAMSDVLKRSDAPRGSVYFHFPCGKNQLVTEAVEAHAHQQVEIIDGAAEEAGYIAPPPST
jgi:TetR/AcrR family transcriptional repressor of lmrAB and yxaGH operons